MIQHLQDPAGVRAEQLRGLFEGWAAAPTPNRHLERLRVSDLVCDDELVPFHERLGLRRPTAMGRRDPGAPRR